VVFTFEGPPERSATLYTNHPTGHVKTDDWDRMIHPAELMFRIKRGASRDNRWRARGYSNVTVDGWIQTPVVDPRIPMAYWAYGYHTDKGQKYVTVTAIKLERDGYTEMQWIGESEQFRGVRQTMDAALAAYRLPNGNGYSDFDPRTDKVAENSLGAIVVERLTGSSWGY